MDFADLLGRRLDPGAVARQIDAEAEREYDDAPHVVRVMPVFAGPTPAGTAGTAGCGDWTLPESALDRAAELAGDRRAAADRMALPVFRSASAEAHDRLRRTEAEEVETVGEGAFDRDAAMALGTAVHSMMENLDLASALAPQVAEHRVRIVADIKTFDDGDEGKNRAEDLLTQLSEGSCLDRLEAMAGHVVARELPIMLWSKEPDSPGAVVSGIVDLVYRDPDDGRVVVADYKTDHIEGEEAIAERTAVYEPQVRIYARALRAALDLDHEPHVELWFLAADRIVRL